jgi:hypothetical protein
VREDYEGAREDNEGGVREDYEGVRRGRGKIMRVG